MSVAKIEDKKQEEVKFEVGFYIYPSITDTLKYECWARNKELIARHSFYAVEDDTYEELTKQVYIKQIHCMKDILMKMESEIL